MDSVDNAAGDSASESAEERVKAKLEAIEAEAKANVESEVSEVDVPSGESAAPAETSSEGGDSASGGQVSAITRGEVSATTVARMMGLATATEISMLEGKIDLLSSRVNNITAKLERLNGVLSQMPTGTDLDRIDINIGSLKTLIKETLEAVSTGVENEKATGEEGTLSKAKIMSSSEE